MSKFITDAKDRVPLGQKAAFGAGHLVLNLYPGALGFFMFFLLTAFGMDPFLAGLLGGLPRFFDAITTLDPDFQGALVLSDHVHGFSYREHHVRHPFGGTGL